jgi:hypothetical protein
METLLCLVSGHPAHWCDEIGLLEIFVTFTRATRDDKGKTSDHRAIGAHIVETKTEGALLRDMIRSDDKGWR